MVKPLRKSFAEEKKSDHQASPMLLLPAFYDGYDFIEVNVDQIIAIEYMKLDKRMQKEKPECSRIRIYLTKEYYDTLINMDRFREMLAYARRERVDVDCRAFRTKLERDAADLAAGLLKRGRTPNAT